jgi:Predicted nucleotide-binding protein containing TIR-like domain
LGRPRLFVGSSSESLSVAYGIHENLEANFEVTVWTQGAFLLNKGTLEELVRFARESDAAVMVFSNDDVAQIRGSNVSVTRDNVVFELGLFLGALGRDSAFVVAPKGADLHLPSDLAGIVIASYDASRQDGNWAAATGPACNRIRETFNKAASARRANTTVSVPEPSFAPALEWLLNQISIIERQALLEMCRDGVFNYSLENRNKYKSLRNCGLARTSNGRSMSSDNQLVPTPLGTYLAAVLKSREQKA